MPDTRQPPVRYIDRTRAQYEALGYGGYDWARSDGPPVMATLPKPLDECRLGLIATGGVYRVGQTAFHYRDDVSYRAIPSDVDPAELRATHFAYDLTDARRDINVVFPVEALRALAAEGVVGELAPQLFTCMGGIYSQRQVRDELAPRLLDRCRADRIDVVLLVPV